MPTLGGTEGCRTVEEVRNLTVDRKEAVDLSRRLEALHDALASSGGLMSVLRVMVQAPVRRCSTPGMTSLGRAVADQLVRDRHATSDALLLEELSEQPLGRLCVAPALNQDVEHGPVLVHGPPQPMLPAADADDDFIEMPFVSGCGQSPADLVGKALTELQRPLPLGLDAWLCYNRMEVEVA